MPHATAPDPAQPSPVQPREISALLDQLHRLAPGDVAGRLAFHERKADLLTRIAAEMGTDQARQAAADAHAQAAELRSALGRGPGVAR